MAADHLDYFVTMTDFIQVARRLSAVLVVALFVALPTPVTAKWYRYENCRLLTQDFNDGDSFHIKCKRRHYIFRLYFVDTPETETSFPDRVKEQADYWGLTPAQAVALGHKAARFTRAFLAQPFTVHTRRVDARGRSDRPRYFAMIETDTGFLSAALVRRGLARIHGMSTELPDGRPSSRHWGRLRLAEKAARREALGGWADTPPAPKPLPDIEPQDFIVRNRVPVFDPERYARLIGVLRRGARIRILRAESHTLLRIRFKIDKGNREGICRRDDVRLPAFTGERE